jgi:cytochrome P450
MPTRAVLDLGSLDPSFSRDSYLSMLGSGNRCPFSRSRCTACVVGWLVTRYADVRQALNELSNDRANAAAAARAVPWLFADEALGLHRHMLRSDPPAHTRIRRVVAPAFTSRRVARIRPRIEQIATELVDAFAGRGRPS